MAMRETIWQSKLAPPQRLVALALVDHADRQGACYPGTARLVQRTGLCRRSVLRAVAGLEAARIVQTAKGHGRKARYQFPLVPQSHQSEHEEPASLVPQSHQSEPPALEPKVVHESHRCTTVTGASESRGGASESPPREDVSKGSQVVLELAQELDPVRFVFEHWSKTLWSKFHQRKPKLTPERRRKFEARLREYSVEDLCRAIDAVTESPFHLGVNDRGRPYIEPETIFKTASKVDGWLAAKVRTVGSATRRGPAQPDHDCSGWED